MGLLDVFRKRGGSKKRMRLATPWAAAQEVRERIQRGQLAQALEIAEQGIERFPHSDAMQAAFRLLKREGLSEDLATYRAECERDGSAQAFTRLADAYREMGEYDKASEVCREAIERFPEHEGPWYVLGRIRFERFREDWLARDGLLAIEYYEQAYDRNRTSFRALIDLADLYTRIGAKRRAIRRCEAILYFAPEDERALALLQKATALPKTDKSLEELVESFAEKQRKALARRGRKAGEGPAPDVLLVREPERLQRKLDWLARHLEGLNAVIGLDRNGTLCAGLGSGDFDGRELAAALAGIFEVARDCSLRMDIGRFRTAVFEGPSGLCYMIQVGELQIALLCEPGVRLERVEAVIERFVEDELYR